jgi:hypothetical protein
LNARRGNSTKQKARIQARLDAAKTAPAKVEPAPEDKAVRREKQIKKEQHDQAKK